MTKLKIALLLADSSFKSLATDQNLLQIYGESILQITYYRLKELFDKIIVVVNNFDQQSMYARQLGEDVIVNMHKEKNEVTAALTAFSACKKIPDAESAFIVAPNMPLISKDAVQVILKEAAIGGKNALIPQHANGNLETFHAMYKITPALNALEKANNDGRKKLADALSYMSYVFYLPANEIIKVDPQLNTFLKVDSDIAYLKAKEKLQGKIFKSRIKKAEKISADVKKNIETESTVYFSVPGTEETHEAIYHKRTKKWSCDCRHFVMRATQCSHIIAAAEYALK